LRRARAGLDIAPNFNFSISKVKNQVTGFPVAT